ncbi:MAG TPA: hypothetical protein ENN50_00400, partial [Prosthecochloris aestuarii]|nr:hypothetical protein [Prosthecochloris aestuarii]
MKLSSDVSGLCIRKRFTLVMLSCLLSLSQNGTASAEVSSVLPVAAEFERQAILQEKIKAKPIDLSGITITRPAEVDYSGYLTYIRNQNAGPGCMTYATLHAADIINEFQAPYTPDLSWQYALRTWHDLYNAKILQKGDTVPPDLNNTFNPGVSSEALCRSESDYLTPVPKTDSRYDGKLSSIMYWDPQPTAEARQEAPQYRFEIGEPITPDVETLKTLLLTYGPVWASGGWWWNGAHAMTFVGYSDVSRTFKVVDSSGDWAHQHGIVSIPYDKLTEYVSALRVVTMLPSTRHTGRWAYSSRIRIRGTWRGTWTVKIGVEGREPLLVYRTYGRKADRPYAHGERLDLDVPLPAYAAEYWPPKAGARWYLQVEDNDRDTQTGYVMEWTLARRYEDPACRSVDRWKTQTFTYSKTVYVPDATGEPEIPAGKRPNRGNTRPFAYPANSQPGVARLYMPENAVQGAV